MKLRKLTLEESAPLARAALERAACELIEEHRVLFFKLRRDGRDLLLPGLARKELVDRAREIAPREIRRRDLYHASAQLFRFTPATRGYVAPEVYDPEHLRPLHRSRVLVLLDEQPIRDAIAAADRRSSRRIPLRRRRRWRTR